MEKTLGVFLFPNCELLDVASPIQMLASIVDIRVRLLGPSLESVTSAVGQNAGPRFLPDDTWDTADHLDMLMVPDGHGARTEITNPHLLSALMRHTASAELVTSVCTGAALLAKAGLLDGKRTTTNKMAFVWVKEQGPQTTWVPTAR